MGIRILFKSLSPVQPDWQGNRMNDVLMAISPFAPPPRADELLLAALPTLKRGANDPCASGAIRIGTCLVNKEDSCDCPGVETPCSLRNRVSC